MKLNETAHKKVSRKVFDAAKSIIWSVLKASIPTHYYVKQSFNSEIRQLKHLRLEASRWNGMSRMRSPQISAMRLLRRLNKEYTQQKHCGFAIRAFALLTCDSWPFVIVLLSARCASLFMGEESESQISCDLTKKASLWYKNLLLLCLF